MNEMQQPVTVSAFRPGDWFGIVGPAVSVFLPPSEKSRVGSLWEIVDGGADFDEVLDTLIASGLRSLPGFLLLGSSAPETRVVVRGPARAVFALASGEQVTIDGVEARTWQERTLSDVTRVSVLLEEDPGEPGDRSVDTGLVRVARVDRPPFVAEPPHMPAPPAPAPEVPEAADAAWGAQGGQLTPPAPMPDAVVGEDAPLAAPALADLDAGASGAAQTWSDDTAAEQTEPEHAGFAETEPESTATDILAVEQEPDPAGDAGDDVSESPSWSTPSALDAPEVPGWPPSVADVPEPSLEPPLSVGSWRSDDDPDTDAPGLEAETEVFDVAEIAAQAPAEQAPETPAPWPAPSVGEQPASEMPAWGQASPGETPEHDGQTVSGGWDAGEFARRQPGIPGQPPAPEVTAQPVATLVFAHGEVVAVDRAILIGRAPEARRFTSTEQPRLVTVPSPNQEISSTHLEVRPGSGADHGSAVVTDMGSTNGTVVVQPGFGPESLTPGMPVQLLPGAVIDLGDGMTIQVAGA